MVLTLKQPRVDAIFRALADRTRLRLLNLLRAGGELCVCDLVDVLAVPQPTASRHLAYLRKAGLVESRKDGYWSYYRLSETRGEFHRKLLDCLACCTPEMPELTRDEEKLEKRLSAKICCGPAPRRGEPRVRPLPRTPVSAKTAKGNR